MVTLDELAVGSSWELKMTRLLSLELEISIAFEPVVGNGIWLRFRWLTLPFTCEDDWFLTGQVLLQGIP